MSSGLSRNWICRRIRFPVLENDIPFLIAYSELMNWIVGYFILLSSFCHSGPATVRMVSTGSPPVPLPVQVPPGHVLQQIVDERGTLRHVILSPAPAATAAAVAAAVAAAAAATATAGQHQQTTASSAAAGATTIVTPPTTTTTTASSSTLAQPPPQQQTNNLGVLPLATPPHPPPPPPHYVSIDFFLFILHHRFSHPSDVTRIVLAHSCFFVFFFTDWLVPLRPPLQPSSVQLNRISSKIDSMQKWESHEMAWRQWHEENCLLMTSKGHSVSGLNRKSVFCL